MSQKLWILLIVIGSIGSFFYFKKVDKNYQQMDKTLLALGGLFVIVGSLIVLSLDGIQGLFEFLLLKEAGISGKMILIGYVFLLISMMIFIEKQIVHFFKTHRDS